MSVKFYAFLVAGMALAALAMPDGAGAQPLSEPAESIPHETVLIYAPYVVTRTVIDPMMSKGSSTGVELVSESRMVSFGDLNLSNPADAQTLENRVRQAAADACSDIETRYPKADYRPIPANQDCAGNAIKQAMVTVRQLEAAAAIY